MSHYPLLTVYQDRITRNAGAICRACAEKGISVAGVVKGACGVLPVIRAVAAGSVSQIASSRLDQLARSKAALPDMPTMLIRLPQISEAAETVAFCDYSLNSEEQTLRALSEAAVRAGVLHKVILMVELGDLREGVFSQEALLSLAELAEALPGLTLAGVGANLNCVYAVCPSEENMNRLVQAAEAVERLIGHPLEIVSGGSTTSIPMMLEGGLPEKINHLRVGEAILAGQDLPFFWHCQAEGAEGDALLLEAEIIECGVKPSAPWGRQQTNAFGELPPKAEDRGLRRRAILAMGRQDIGDPSQLICLEPGAKVIAASSDHLLVDVEDCPRVLKPGDILAFRMFYESMLFAFHSGYVTKEYR